MITQEQGENRAHYMMRVAAAYIRKNCPEKSIEYDETECDGYCIADELESALYEIPFANAQISGGAPSAGDDCSEGDRK